jgi:hypothetical protein
MATFSGPAQLMDNGQHVDIDVVVWTQVATQTF